MRRLAVVLLLVTGCNTESGEMYPIYPGGGGGTGGSTRADAAVEHDGGDASTSITARVCLLKASMHTLESGACASSGAGNFTVKLGTEMAMTADDGSFTIMRPTNTAGLYWSVTGATIQGSKLKLGGEFGSATMRLLPVFDTTAYLAMVSNNNTSSDNGGIVVRVRKAGIPVAGATVDTMPTPVSQTFYDGASDDTWETDATGPFGVAWIPDIQGSSAQLVSVTLNAMPTDFTSIPLAADTITFIAADIP